MALRVPPFKVIGTDTDRSAIYDFHGPISYRFRDYRRFLSIIAKFSHPVNSTPPLRGSLWNWLTPDGLKKLEWWGCQAEKEV